MSYPEKKRKTFYRSLSWGLLIVAMTSAAPAMSDTSSNTLSSTGSDSSNCSAITASVNNAIQQAANSIQNQAQQTYEAVPQPANLSSSTCFSNIFNMGTNIGLSFFNPTNLIQQLSQMACNAAQQALQWPMQQAESAINNNLQLPYGMGGITAGQGSNGISVNTFSSSGPSVSSLPTGGGSTLGGTISNALSNTLSNALGG